MTATCCWAEDGLKDKLRWGAGLLLLASGLLIAHALYFDYIAEDAFISFRYARHLSEGRGLVWNDGERVEGYTNPLWVFMLAGMNRLGGDMLISARIIGLVCGVGMLIVTWLLAGRIGLTGWWRGLPALFLACNGAAALWAYAGLETALFTLLVLSGVYLFFRRFPARNPLADFLLCLAALTRPEGILVYFLLLLFGLCLVMSGKDRVSLLRYLLPVLCFALPFGLFLLWRHAYFGCWLPNTFYAKTGGGFAQASQGWHYTIRFFRHYGGFLFALPLILPAFKSVDRTAYFSFLLSIVYTAYIVLIGGDSLVRARFFVPLLPFFYLLISLAAAAVIRHVGLRRGPPMAGAALLLLCALFLTLSPSAGGEKNRQAVRDLMALGRWLNENGPDRICLALNAAGAVPYYTDYRVIDMLGLNDRHIARRKMPAMGKGFRGHEKYDADYVLSRNPDWIMFGSKAFHAFPLGPGTPGEKAASLAFWPSDRALWRKPEFHMRYEPASLRIGPEKFFNFFRLRRTGRPAQGSAPD
jgi:hypothetical protein